MIEWLQDNFQWYRRFRGGRWARWNGFWERQTVGMYVLFRRGRKVIAGEVFWDYHACLPWDDKNISEREEW